jgi:DNA-binding NtrC family response regulator
MDSGKPFDVVVLDLIIPGGMGGKETIEMLKTVDPGVKAILTSGHAVDPVLTNFWEYGFFGVIRKPFVIKELDVSIRQALEEV